MGIVEIKEFVGNMCDALVVVAEDFDGKKFMDEVKDLSPAEYIEIGYMLVLKAPSIYQSFKKPI